MSNFRTQIRDYYESKALPSQRVEEILAAGRAVASGDAPASIEEKVVPLRPLWRAPHFWLGLAAAAVVMLVGVAGLDGLRRPAMNPPYAALEARLIEFFSGDYDIPKVTQDQAALREWLIERGAPEHFEIPPSLVALEAYGCRVLDVDSKDTYLICFWLPPLPGQEDRELLHLVVSRRAEFEGSPREGEIASNQIGAWAFVGWAEGEIVYTLGSTEPLARIQSLAHVVARPTLFAVK